jgi:DNA-binding NarL/FixJ family response regulator
LRAVVAPCLLTLPPEIEGQPVNQSVHHRPSNLTGNYICVYHTILAWGNSIPQISRRLDLKQRTVRFHVQSATRRLGARSRVHAVSLALQQGLILPGERW